MNLEKLKKIFDESGRFVLVCHQDPDGDAIGSLSALAQALEANGKEVVRVCKDPVPDLFSFLLERATVSTVWPENFDVIVLLDNGDFRRTGFQAEILAAKKAGIPVVNIDHHPKNDLWRVAKVNCADPAVSSTCEIVYDILTDFKHDITNSIATALLAGIFYDTGSFQHKNTTTKVLEITGELLRKGAKLKTISNRLVSARSFALFKLWGIALDRLTVNEKYKISYSVLTQNDLAETAASEEEIFGLVNLLNTNSSGDATLLLYETADGKIKGSLRTEKDNLNLTKLASLFCGGGHRKAAGFSLTGKIKAVGKGWEVE